jgi:hypothetical protein
VEKFGLIKGQNRDHSLVKGFFFLIMYSVSFLSFLFFLLNLIVPET